jgi:dTDP-4-dehydrorhamnose 3,5-epimerase-like enzyme
MAKLIDLKTFTDSRGNLTVIERTIPFDIKRIFYIYGVDNSMRGGHRHHKTFQAAISLKGKCRIINYDGIHGRQDFLLERPDQCLIIEPTDWHQMDQFSPDAILMVLASEYFSQEDYIYKPYSR